MTDGALLTNYGFFSSTSIRNGTLVHKVSRCNSNHLDAFFFPNVYDTAFDNFTRMHAEADGRAYFYFRFAFLRQCC